MAREKKDNQKTAWTPEHVAMARKIALVVLIVVVAGALGGVGLYQIRQYVARSVAPPTEPPTVVLTNRPSWMSDLVCEQICSAARPQQPRSALDSQALRDVVDSLQRNPRVGPWISKINHVKLLYVHKPGDTLEVDCEYRIPVALVHGQSKAPDGVTNLDYYYLVDSEGLALPERYAPDQLGKVIYGRNGRMNIRLIEGVTAPPPTLPGKTWPGDDLRAGLEMARALAGLPYAEQIMKIDVSNFQGRIKDSDAHIVLWTNHVPPTRILWGRPESDKGSGISEIPPKDKLQRLEALVKQFGRVDAGKAWVDVRFDQVEVPPEAPPAPAPPASPATPAAPTARGGGAHRS